MTVVGSYLDGYEMLVEYDAYVGNDRSCGNYCAIVA